MKLVSAIIIAVVFFALSSKVYSAPNIQPFPLDQVVTTLGYAGDDLSLDTTCVVSKKNDNDLYSYAIRVSYKTNKEMLLTWDFLDWILSQYPNAVAAKRARVHIFPLKVGNGEYVFRFQSKESPIWFEGTLIHLFSKPPANAQEQKDNIEIDEAYSGVTVSSHDYISASVGLGAASCLPADLLVFPANLRSGF